MSKSWIDLLVIGNSCLSKVELSGKQDKQQWEEFSYECIRIIAKLAIAKSFEAVCWVYIAFNLVLYLHEFSNSIITIIMDT